MGVQNTNQHLRTYVSTASAGVAFVNDGGSTDNGVADLAAGQVTYMNTATGVCSATPPTSGKYKVVYKSSEGNTFESPEVDSAYAVVTSGTPVADVMQVSTLTIPAPAVGDQLVVKVGIYNYGGFLDANAIHYVYANHTAESTTAADAAAALRTNLAAGLAKCPVSVATVSGSGANIVVTGVAQKYTKNKFEGAVIKFFVEQSQPAANAQGSTLTTAPKDGKNTYRQVASMEDFYAGYDSDYINRQGNWPYDGTPFLETDSMASTSTFNSHTITFKNPYGAANAGTQRQVINVFYKQ